MKGKFMGKKGPEDIINTSYIPNTNDKKLLLNQKTDTSKYNKNVSNVNEKEECQRSY